MHNKNPELAKLLLQENNYLISLPEICLTLKKVLADPMHSTKDISQVIMHDPALSMRLLRIVNSAYYGLQAPATDITHALGILGEKDLNNLVVVTSIVKTMAAIGGSVDLGKFWRQSMFCAVTARNFAQHCLKKNKEELFIAGLLLKVGKLLIYHREPELQNTVQQEMIKTQYADYLIENKLLGFQHAEVGAMMSKKWNFSPLLIDSIEHQYKKPDDSSSIAHQIIYLANYCTTHLEFNLETLDMQDDLNIDFLSTHKSLINHLMGNEKTLIETLQVSYEEYFNAYDTFVGK